LSAGTLAFIGVQNKAKRNILKQTWHDLLEAFFLIALFAVISMINILGGFQIVGEKIGRHGNRRLWEQRLCLYPVFSVPLPTTSRSWSDYQLITNSEHGSIFRWLRLWEPRWADLLADLPRYRRLFCAR
jgi:hypothetical protein